MYIRDVATGKPIFKSFDKVDLDSNYNGVAPFQIYQAKCTEYGFTATETDFDVTGSGILEIPLQQSCVPNLSSSRLIFYRGVLHLYNDFPSNNNATASGDISISFKNFDDSNRTIPGVGFDEATPEILPSFTIPLRERGGSYTETKSDSYVHITPNIVLFYLKLIRIGNGGFIEWIVEFNRNTKKLDIFAKSSSGVAGSIANGQFTGLLAFNNTARDFESTEFVNTENSRLFQVEDIYNTTNKFQGVFADSVVVDGTVFDGINRYTDAKITLSRSDNGLKEGSSTTDVNGNFSITAYDDTEYMLVCQDTDEGNSRNALIFDKVTGV